ncbi:MAG: hypothetical protein PHU88_05545 [candidate division Zixibacteria bacterium]|nr:hypothetical protein [candidate division Zixibacteria bacterium]MDD5426112.1 hypothetical protein [candidate division Zixibacteria bacterium]
MHLARFWSKLEPHKDNTAYKTYFEEYNALFNTLIELNSLKDLTIDELQSISNVAEVLKEIVIPKIDKTYNKTISILIKKLFFIGEFKQALSFCEKYFNASFNIKTDDIAETNELDSLREISLRARSKYPKLYRFLLDIQINWESIQESTSPKGVFCLFVEKDDLGMQCRGRMKQLTGRVELNSNQDSIDEVTFHNQIKTPDDPFIGVAYDALKAVRQLFLNLHQVDKTIHGYHSHFSITDSQQTFTGDSIGLAFALVAYTQLIKPDITRFDKFISSEVTLTGSIDAEGKLAPVNNDTLFHKIERAFFSPIKYLILPEINLTRAKLHLEKLNRQYPHRHLYLIGHNNLREVIEDHNIIRDEKVCTGTLIIRKITRINRMTIIQIPLLFLLTYFLTCLIFPKTWLWFDWNPQYVQLTEKGFRALNVDSTFLWDKEFECELIPELTSWKIGDFDKDKKNEIAFSPTSLKNIFCEDNNNLFIYDNNDKILCNKEIVICNEYINDDTVRNAYTRVYINFFQMERFDTDIIVTSTSASYPSRTQIRFWKIDGTPLGWYINAGATHCNSTHFLYSPKIGAVFGCVNRRMSCAGLLIVKPDSSFGVSPPYQDSLYDLSWVKRGNQLCYIMFPPTEMIAFCETSYNHPHLVRIDSDSTLCIEIREDFIYNIKVDLLLFYYLNINTLRIYDVKLSDNYITYYNKLVSENKLKPVNWDSFKQKLLDTVTYWIDSTWVTEGQLRTLENNIK